MKAQDSKFWPIFPSLFLGQDGGCKKQRKHSRKLYGLSMKQRLRGEVEKKHWDRVKGAVEGSSYDRLHDPGRVWPFSRSWCLTCTVKSSSKNIQTFPPKQLSLLKRVKMQRYESITLIENLCFSSEKPGQFCTLWYSNVYAKIWNGVSP